MERHKGEVDAALALHHERLATFEALGDRASRAVTLGDIARIKAAIGEFDAALALHEERLATFEALGDSRSRAVTLGDIARIKTVKGEVDTALALHNERLRVNRGLGDQDEIAAAQFDIGQIQLARAVERGDQAAFQVAFKALSESHAIFQRTGRLEGICTVGMLLAQVLAVAGQTGEALVVATRSLKGFEQLGWAPQTEQARELLRQLGE